MGRFARRANRAWALCENCPSCQSVATRRCCRAPQISGRFRAVPFSIRGALRGRHERWERDAVDAAVSLTSDTKADGKVVWS